MSWLVRRSYSGADAPRCARPPPVVLSPPTATRTTRKDPGRHVKTEDGHWAVVYPPIPLSINTRTGCKLIQKPWHRLIQLATKPRKERTTDVSPRHGGSRE